MKKILESACFLKHIINKRPYKTYKGLIGKSIIYDVVSEIFEYTFSLRLKLKDYMYKFLNNYSLGSIT